jgi:hypothetical protein
MGFVAPSPAAPPVRLRPKTPAFPEIPLPTRPEGLPVRSAAFRPGPKTVSSRDAADQLGDPKAPLPPGEGWWFAALQAPGWCCSPRHRGDVGSSPAAPDTEVSSPAPAPQCVRPVHPSRRPPKRPSVRWRRLSAVGLVPPSPTVRSVPAFRLVAPPKRPDPCRPCSLELPLLPGPTIRSWFPAIAGRFHRERTLFRSAALPAVPPLDDPSVHDFWLCLALPWPSPAAVPPRCSCGLLDPAGVGLPAPRTRCNL